MRYAIKLGPYGDHADPRRLAALAHDAEVAGWDGTLDSRPTLLPESG